MTAQRYSEPTYAARYLEAEWGDYLLKHASFPEGLSHPYPFLDRNVRFYSSIVDMLQETCARCRASSCRAWRTSEAQAAA